MCIELWGGVECSVCRVGETYFDQVERSGHEHRIQDLDRFAELGIRTLRYPVLWERTAPEGVPDWRWCDDRLRRLCELRIEPIVGLVHHGSGPRCTSLLDSHFPERLASYARYVANRYPWVRHYTPVNEPLTTARFSCLYGNWYPHARDANSFVRALLLQCKAVVLAMHEIRRINSEAKLVQTEDLGRVFSLPALSYQAEFENTRRWLTWYLLIGHVDSSHPMWSFLMWTGVPDGEVLWFQENPCPPDIIGIDHYVTSDRFLDERLERYPRNTWGGNGRQQYADVEAVRVLPDASNIGVEGRIREAWQRFHAPLAITEAHLGCSDEADQVCWFCEAWAAAKNQHAQGVDIRAVTAWSLLGAFDWNSLMMNNHSFYEPGAFDVQNEEMKCTALGRLLREIGSGGADCAPQGLVKSQGWWRQPQRILYPTQ
jgi:dTDP-4-dehydrorhamnose reductase